MDTLFQTASGDYQLQRFPLNKKETLRAWDAADEYLLQHLHDENLLKDKSSILIISDGFGALPIALNSFNPWVMTDSYLSTQSITVNAETNNIDENSIKMINSLDQLDNLIDGSVDVVLIKVPKSLAMLEDQLYRIRSVINNSTVIIAAAMTKHIHLSTMELFEKIVGSTHTSRARKKSRLIFCTVDASLAVGENPYPKSYALPYNLDDIEIVVKNHAAVFSQEKLDLGTRFFIENIPESDQYQSILDLGCGNGVLGLMAAIKNSSAKIIFTDESYMAVESSILNFVSIFDDSREAEFLQTDCLQDIDENSVSLVLCNPPFHQNNAINDNVAWQMFSESLFALEDKGELWVVGNRHLAYHAKLKRIFGNCEIIASNKKFVIHRSVKETKVK
ncbi:23S rRNA (guanine(1835)-N(2))-methyltransferase [hydrothermal vent metagenome]|uniref:23S rRNA (Guanine(1835)-N(2))-methyltransferase n=1 Tax=hydrothermal vent metagenome TaxID=652676 RepID=A0A3B0W4A4_9ZZZZ